MFSPVKLSKTLQRKKWNKTQLARYVGVHPSTIGRYIQGKRVPPAETVRKMAAALGCSYRSLQTFFG